MTFQLNTDNTLSIHEAFGTLFDDLLSEELSRFGEHITRLEVHLSDEHGSKDGLHDKRCLLEARLKGRQPIAVTEVVGTHVQAVNRVIDKLKASPDTILGCLKNN